jgi:hypothetical protein
LPFLNFVLIILSHFYHNKESRSYESVMAGGGYLHGNSRRGMEFRTRSVAAGKG